MLHIANTNFEEELESEQLKPIEQALLKNPIYRQLQFLPLLYAEPNDGIAVTDMPDKPVTWPLHLLAQPGSLPYKAVSSWGYSQSVAAWAKKHDLAYDMPPWEVVRKVNSKAFSFAHSPKLDGASLLYTIDEVKNWWRATNGPKVLKSCYGLSGRGHLFEEERIESFVRPQFAKKLPVIGEPWVERDLDFSTQWEIDRDKQFSYLGITLCMNNAKGKYTESRVGDEEMLLGKYFPFLAEHRAFVQKLLEKIAALGFFGNIGIDAMIYAGGKLHPVVEVNARKTMGWVALRFQQKHFPKQTIALNYSTNCSGKNLLPAGVVLPDGSVQHFDKQLRINLISR